MPKLKLGPVADDRPVKVTLELPAALHRDLIAYADLLTREGGQPITEPASIASMIARFMATDRAFAKARAESVVSAYSENMDTPIGVDRDRALDIFLAKLSICRKAGFSFRGDHTALNGSSSARSGR